MNETIVGKALQPFRDKVIIATKVGNRWNDEKTGWSWDASRIYIKTAVKDSLKDLARIILTYISFMEVRWKTTSMKSSKHLRS